VVAPAYDAALYDRAAPMEESAVQLWAVMRALERVPAEADDQQRFLEVKRRVETRLRAAGLDPTEIERSFNAAEIGRLRLQVCDGPV
jgi:hypothetical protein